MEEGVERRGGRGGGGGGEVLHCSVGVAREKQWGHHRENPEPVRKSRRPVQAGEQEAHLNESGRKK